MFFFWPETFLISAFYSLYLLKTHNPPLNTYPQKVVFTLSEDTLTEDLEQEDLLPILSEISRSKSYTNPNLGRVCADRLSRSSV